MLKLPIGGPRRPIITQFFGNTSNNAWYQANGVNIPSHNGVDFVTGTPLETYGTPLVCPFPTAKVIKISFVSPLYTKGNGVTLEYKYDGLTFQLVLWHTGEVKVKLGDKVKEGDVICYIGNSGLCNPPPTTDNPYAGSHLHLMLYVDGVLTDPMKWFNGDWYVGEDSGIQHDVEPIKWGVEKLGYTDWFLKFLYALRFWKK